MADPKFNERDAGLLMVFADPGQQATENEFHGESTDVRYVYIPSLNTLATEWYENEHIPLRTSSIPEFLSAARYKVVSSSFTSSTDTEPSAAFKAPWSALYAISSNAIFGRPPYTHLRANRSKREADLVGRLGVLDRRIYRLVYDSAAEGAIDISVDSRDGIGPAPAQLSPMSKASVEQCAPYVVATSVTPAPDNKHAYDEWYAREHVGMLKKVPGWQRTRRYELIDVLVNGKDVKPNNGDGDEVPLCLGLHEYTDVDFEQTAEYKAALNTEWRTRVIEGGIVRRERRVMHLYKAFEPESALNAHTNVTMAAADDAAAASTS